jgi:hypothetical protein
MSGENVAYHLRQNKYVERQLFVEILSHLDRVRRIRDYVYVGFGGPYMEDFKLLHSTFGISRMISLEELEWVLPRQRFNQPFGCVGITKLSSAEFVERYEDILASYGHRNVITWFDFADPGKISEELADLQGLLRQSIPFDVVKITLNANLNALFQPSGTVTKEEIKARRFQKFKGRLKNLVPPGASEEMMTPEQYPALLLRAVQLAVTEELTGKPIIYHPISAFTYSDTEHRMLTLTGIVLTAGGQKVFLDESGIRDFEFATNSWSDHIEVSIPNLSAREKLYLDQVLFTKLTTKRAPIRLRAGVPLRIALGETVEKTRDEAARYFRFYRYYPHFHPVQY